MISRKTYPTILGSWMFQSTLGFTIPTRIVWMPSEYLGFAVQKSEGFMLISPLELASTQETTPWPLAGMVQWVRQELEMIVCPITIPLVCLRMVSILAGIMVARLKGNCSPVVSRITELDHHSQLCFNTVIGNKKGNLIDPTHQFDEVVLQQRTQVVPLVSFHKTWNDVCPHFLHTLHVKIQSIIDQYFNDGHQTRAGYYENNDQMKELPFRKRRIRRIRKSELKRIRTDKRNVAQRPVSSPLAVMTHKTVSPPAVVPPLLSLDQGQNHLSLSSAPPRLFDPTSPLWDDFPPPLPSHSTRLPVEASQSFDLAPGHGGPSRIVHLGDTTLPPPFPNSWSFNAQAQGIQQPPQIDEWGFPIDSKPCKTN